VRRVPALLEVSIGEQAARPDVARGQGVTLVIRRSTATISTQGTALKDVEVGEVAPFRVHRTGKVVQARVRSSTLALVLEER
jgi:flagella basal body P-ring formation protein FlgA